MLNVKLSSLGYLTVALRALPLLAVVACHSTPFDPARAYGIASLDILPDSAILSSEPSILTLNGTTELSVVLSDSIGQPVSVDIVPEWASSNPSVAIVTASGTVVGVMPGIATIRATIGSVHGFSTVTVRPASDTGILIAAHRGFRSVYPENTIPAITGAFEWGADAVEIDVRLTVDDVPILMHDETVDRTTNGTGAVRVMTLAQIEQLDACSKFGDGWAPCTVPTLREALGAGRGYRLLILDLKGAYPNASLAALVNMVRAEGMSQRVVLASDNYQVLLHLRELDEVIPLGFYDTELPLVEDMTRLGRTAGMPGEQALLAAPGEASSLLRSADSEHVSIMVWTITSEAEAEALVALGVRGLMTDIPLDRNTLSQITAPTSAASVARSVRLRSQASDGRNRPLDR